MTNTRDWTGYTYRIITGPAEGGTATVTGPVPGGWQIERSDGEVFTMSSRILAQIATTTDRAMSYHPEPLTDMMAAAWERRPVALAARRARRK